LDLNCNCDQPRVHTRAASSLAVHLPPEPLVDLNTWVSATYSPANAPCVNTVRRWVRENRIQPAPEKQGRGYFFHPRAKYVARGKEAQ
jgi:hypothetical protein